MNVRRCDGEGQGSCTRCEERGKWNRSWMHFLYEVEGQPGIYCLKCVGEIMAEQGEGDTK